MSSINFLIIFDVVILGYGLIIIFAAIKMKKTGIPAGILIPEEDIIGSKDPKGFCEAMYAKTLGFGVVCVLYGVISMISDIVMQSNLVNSIALAVLIVAVLFYCNVMRQARYKFIK